MTPLGRGPDGWYAGAAEVDFFEVWADLARRFRLDPRRVALSGYSMGGYGTYKLGMQWPDLFGAAFTTVGPPVAAGYLDTSQLIENARWVPYMNWAGRTDASVPIAFVRAQQQRFDSLGLRSQLWTYPGGHYDFAAGDRWEGARAFLAASVVQRDPPRVDYAFLPGRTGPASASFTTTRTGSRTCAHALAGAARSAPAASRSDAQPTPSRRASAEAHDPPEPESVSGTEWQRIPARRSATRSTCGSTTSAAPTSTGGVRA